MLFAQQILQQVEKERELTTERRHIEKKNCCK